MAILFDSNAKNLNINLSHIQAAFTSDTTFSAIGPADGGFCPVIILPLVCYEKKTPINKIKIYVYEENMT